MVVSEQRTCHSPKQSSLPAWMVRCRSTVLASQWPQALLPPQHPGLQLKGRRTWSLIFFLIFSFFFSLTIKTNEQKTVTAEKLQNTEKYKKIVITYLKPPPPPLLSLLTFFTILTKKEFSLKIHTRS